MFIHLKRCASARWGEEGSGLWVCCPCGGTTEVCSVLLGAAGQEASPTLGHGELQGDAGIVTCCISLLVGALCSCWDAESAGESGQVGIGRLPPCPPAGLCCEGAAARSRSHKATSPAVSHLRVSASAEREQGKSNTKQTQIPQRAVLSHRSVCK